MAERVTEPEDRQQDAKEARQGVDIPIRAIGSAVARPPTRAGRREPASRSSS